MDEIHLSRISNPFDVVHLFAFIFIFPDPQIVGIAQAGRKKPALKAVAKKQKGLKQRWA
jgi:hypothetical protein